MDLIINESIKGQYHTFHLKGELNTREFVNFKRILTEVIENKELNICFDLSLVETMDVGIVRFIENVNKTLVNKGRGIAIYGASAEIDMLLKSKLDMKKILVYKNLFDFEKAFEDNAENIRAKYFGVAMGSGPVRRLSLVCPLCETDGIVGYMADDSLYDYVWVDSDITPQWKPYEKNDNALDIDTYEVAVCHRCLFAHSQLEYFKVILPEGFIPSIMTEDQRDRLVKKSYVRGNLLSDFQKDSAKSFFSMPRESLAAYFVWQLYDKCLREISREKSMLNNIEVARANILSAKFANNEINKQNALTTAHVWLTDLITHPNAHTNFDMVRGYVYLMSVSYALGRAKDVKKIFQQLVNQFKGNENYPFWMNRAVDLVDDN